MDEEGSERQFTAEYHFNRASALEELDNFEDALVECETAIQAGWSFLAEAHNLRGIILEGLGQNDEALTAYMQALEIAPTSEVMRENLRALEADLEISDQPVTLAEFWNDTEARFVQQRLAAEGIWSHLTGKFGASGLGFGSAFRGLQLQVRESAVARAMEVLGMEGGEEEL
jgi:tetratricopeptide (TPR) repeat protein